MVSNDPTELARSVLAINAAIKNWSYDQNDFPHHQKIESATAEEQPYPGHVAVSGRLLFTHDCGFKPVNQLAV